MKASDPFLQDKQSHPAPGHPAKDSLPLPSRKGTVARLNESLRRHWKEELTPEEEEKILEQRAAELARERQEEEPGEQIDLVQIRLGREIYGLEVNYICDIYPAALITRVPRVPSWVAGVANLRGKIQSVVRLQGFLNLPEPETPTASPHLVVVEIPAMELALLVDEVLAVEAIPAGRLQEAAGAIRGIPAEYVRGVVAQRGERTENGSAVEEKAEESASLMVVLNVAALLADQRLIVHEEVG